MQLPSKKKKMKILIDNGHGYDTKGKCSPDGLFKEYRWTRQAAQKIVSLLAFMGYDAELLVKEENDISLQERCRRVNYWCSKLGKDNVLLISMHVNAAGSDGKWHTATGWSAYTTRGITKADYLARCLYKEAEKHLVGYKIRKYGHMDLDWDYEENFYILMHTYCPAVLIENFFQDNKEDVKFLSSVTGMQKCCEIVIDGLVGYFKEK